MRTLLATALGIAVIVGMGCSQDDITRVRPGTVFVVARDSFFQPDTMTIAVGIPIRWTNEGTVYHTVVSDSSLWASNLLAPSWWFEVKFDSAGTFPYHCSQHSGMTGTVVVTP